MPYKFNFDTGKLDLVRGATSASRIPVQTPTIIHDGVVKEISDETQMLFHVPLKLDGTLIITGTMVTGI